MRTCAPPYRKYILRGCGVLKKKTSDISQCPTPIKNNNKNSGLLKKYLCPIRGKLPNPGIIPLSASGGSRTLKRWQIFALFRCCPRLNCLHRRAPTAPNRRLRLHELCLGTVALPVTEHFALSRVLFDHIITKDLYNRSVKKAFLMRILEWSLEYTRHLRT